MSDFNTVSHNDFMIEKIKERPINRRKLIRRSVLTASMAVIFGMIACFTFLLLEPVISSWMYPQEEAEQVYFPEDEEEMRPEDMLADNIPEETIVNQEPVNAQLDQEQVDEILEAVEFDKYHYIQLYGVLQDYVEELQKYMVVVTSVTENQDWLEDQSESTDESSGVLIANNGSNLFVLTNAVFVKDADKIQVQFYNGETAGANLVEKHSETDLAILSIPLAEAESLAAMEEIPVASLGSSKLSKLSGTPVVALGSPVGVTDSVEYGMVSAVSREKEMVDFNYDILVTDIYGSPQAQGVLFNMQGQVLGIIASAKENEGMENIITAYGISDLKRLINILSAGQQIPYLGIKGISVTKEANETLQIPYGAYVTEVLLDSPAMHGGLQKGDVIVGIDDLTVEDYGDFESALYNTSAGQIIQVKIMRLSQESYKEMSMDVTLSGIN